MSITFAMTNGDIVIQPNGQPLMVEGYNKVQQDINNVLSHPYEADRDWGNELLVNSVVVVQRSAIPGLVQRDIGAAISRLKRFQSMTPSRYMPNNERIEKVRSITTRMVGNLGVSYVVTISVNSRSDEDVRTVFKIMNEHLER